MIPITPGDLLAAKYRIEAEIGRGAFGRVYRARDVALDRVVAIKELHKGEDDLGSMQFSDYVRRFEREARVQARFNHPNIVHVYELLRLIDDRLYLVMEYVDGESLRDYLARRGPLPVDEAVRIMADLLAGLAAVHADERDIVHRDIKPSNVMLTKAGQAKLTDFGLAQVGDESVRSAAGQPHPGSPLYMSPEQETTSAYLYPASDVFSAGCVLFELLTGAVCKQARRRKQGLTDLRPDTPPWLVEVVAKALARDPDERHADTGKMRERIEADERIAMERNAQAEAETVSRDHPAEIEHQAEDKRRAKPWPQGRRTTAELKRQQAEDTRQRPIWQRIGIELVQIPAGEFLYGDDKQKVTLPEFFLGKTPVTNAQYKAFVDATSHRPPRHWESGQIPPYKADHPVVNVSWDDAQAFCRWAEIRLPTEQEWEKGARGTDGREYPWGNAAPTRKLCNFGSDSFRSSFKGWLGSFTTPVGQHSPQGDSPYGLADMAGNVWEWCSDSSRNSQTARVLRGGSFSDESQELRCANFTWRLPEHGDGSTGFRVASSRSDA